MAYAEQQSGEFDWVSMSSSDVVPSTLVDIAPFLRAADAIETNNPFVAFLCRFTAFEKAHHQHPISNGLGVRLFKTALMRRLERDEEVANLSRGKGHNAVIMLRFHQQYYKKHFEVRQNADDPKYLYQIASVLCITFEVLKEELCNEDVSFKQKILQSHIKIVVEIANYVPDVAIQLYDILKKIEKEIVQTCSHPLLTELHIVGKKMEEIHPRNKAFQPELEPEPEPEPDTCSDQAMLSYLELDHLKIPLYAIKICTQNFDERNFIGKGGYGRVYKGILSSANHDSRPVAVKRLDVTGFQGNKEFYNEVMMLSQYRHENIITLIGFCHDREEMILVYEYASHGSLDAYLSDANTSNQLSWPQLLEICVGVASALDYLHSHMAARHRIIHRDIKSANILLDENWKAKLSDFGLSGIGLANQKNSFVVTNLAGTHGYCDPQYERTGILTKESDVYSFGVVLFEVLCGRLACVLKYNDERRFLYHLARTCYKNGELEKIIDQRIKKHSKPRTLSVFSFIAYQCLQETRAKRPTITEVLLQLKHAKKIQVGLIIVFSLLIP